MRLEGCSELLELFHEYESGHLALGIGAGVSQASHLPGWQELIKRVAERVEGLTRASAEVLLSSGFDAIAVASVLRQHCVDAGEFAEHVRQALYRDFDFPDILHPGNRESFARHVRATNPTLHAVGTFCAVRTGDTFQPNSRVNAVVTLNMDALLQMYTRSRFSRRILRTVERASASASSKLVNVYHVHGFLVRDGTSHRGRDRRAIEAPDRLVLTEQQYFDVVADVHGFVNYSLLHLLRQHRFLFVGLSMTDTNLRRALHLSFTERKRELLSEGRAEHGATRNATRHWAVVRHQNLDVDRALATLLLSVGVRPVWISEWGDVPLVLKSIYESTGERWTGVA